MKALIEVAHKYLNKGVCAIDLAGAEDKYPLSEYVDLFKIIKEKNHEYLGTYERREKMIDSCKILGIDIDKESRRQFARVKCLYCNKERDVRIDTFKKKGGCPYCCGHIENSFYYDNPYLKLYDENKKEINTKEIIIKFI